MWGEECIFLILVVLGLTFEIHYFHITSVLIKIYILWIWFKIFNLSKLICSNAMNAYLYLIVLSAVFMNLRVTLTPLSTFSKYKYLRYPPVGLIFTPFKELSTVFCFNLKYIYRYFYTLSASFSIFCFNVGVRLLWIILGLSKLATTQLPNERFRGKRRRNNYLTVKWMLFQTDQKKISCPTISICMVERLWEQKQEDFKRHVK